MLWWHKTEEVRADKDHYSRNITGDIYEPGWISEMYGYSFGAAELRLRHPIDRDMSIYPGYIPAPGVKYRVFHYGLQFSVGNWSFDKANLRNVDVVNKCWAQFPEPPDPSTLDQTDEDILQQDLLSIECAKKLNEALRLHHKSRDCPDPSSFSKMNSDPTKETVSHRKFGRINRIDTVRSNPIPTNHSQDSSLPAIKDGLFNALKFWVIAIWAFCGVGFLAVMYMIFSGRKGKGTWIKSYRNKRRSSYSGIMDMNGRDRHLRNAELSL